MLKRYRKKEILIKEIHICHEMDTCLKFPYLNLIVLEEMLMNIVVIQNKGIKVNDKDPSVKNYNRKSFIIFFASNYH